MKHYDNTQQFYNSDDWANCKAQVFQERQKDGIIYCEHCGKPIVKGFNPKARNNKGAIVFHHIQHLNNLNVNDASVAINPANIQILHWQCHNEVHDRAFNGFQIPDKKVYIITGASCSGKSTFVQEHKGKNDIVVDIDDIWQLVSGKDRYIKPNQYKPIVFQLRNELKNSIARGLGTWTNAYIIESLPLASDRKMEANKYKSFNVEIITMETSKEECIERLHNNPNGRDVKAYEGYIDKYFKSFI